MIDEALGIASALCRRFEGFYAAPYICPAGRATVGFGCTRYPDGRAVTLRDAPITLKRAEVLLQHELATITPRVLALCPAVDTPGRLAALLDFAYNLGTGNLAASTLRRRVNAGQWDDVPAQLLRWRFAGTRELRGLVLRREAEAALI
jgi:lysozyme